MNEKTKYDILKGREFLKGYGVSDIGAEATDQDQRLPAPLALKAGKGTPRLPLPMDFGETVDNVSLINLIKERKSCRAYSSEALSLRELSFLLWATQGIRYFAGESRGGLGYTLTDEVRLTEGHELRGALGYTLTDEVRRPEGHELRGALGYTLTDEVRRPEGHELRGALGYTLTDEVRPPEGTGRASADIAAGGRQISFRNVPSAGSRHPLETYLFISRVQGIERGIYHYLPQGHELEVWKHMPDYTDELTEALCGQKFAAAAPVIFVWSAVPYRCEWRYGKKSHKYILLDAGHVCENLYLACGAIGCGACAVGAYDQELLDEILDFPPGPSGEKDYECAVYAAAAGRKR